MLLLRFCKWDRHLDCKLPGNVVKHRRNLISRVARTSTASAHGICPVHARLAGSYTQPYFALDMLLSDFKIVPEQAMQG